MLGGSPPALIFFFLPFSGVIAESLSQHNEKHVVPTPLSGIRVGERLVRITSIISAITPCFRLRTSRSYFGKMLGGISEMPLLLLK
jgi:hypothetical protein